MDTQQIFSPHFYLKDGVSLKEFIHQEKPSRPILCARPHRVLQAARWYRKNFPGEVFYALKANPAPWVVEALYTGGIQSFDVASTHEIMTLKARFPEARLAFMNPVKSRQAIGYAYFEAQCRIFALDHPQELEKIRQETNNAQDLTLIIRLSVSGHQACMPLSGKFGIDGYEAKTLLYQTRLLAETCGVTFHVGSQCMAPQSYFEAMQKASEIVSAAGVCLDLIDIGGGFPAPYPDQIPLPLKTYIASIQQGRAQMKIPENARLWCEPGRSLVAEAASVLVKVELRKKDMLYLNDGAYGNLYDAAHHHWLYPVRLLRASPQDSFSEEAPLKTFRLFGPTCDTADKIQTSFSLPENVQEGDYIEIGMLGAYGSALATSFNGFGVTETLFLKETEEETFMPSAFPSTKDIAVM